MKVDYDIANFTAGELSPRMKGRTDFPKYYHACERLNNFVVMPQGGATRRPGTRFVTAALSNATQSRLLPFTFNTIQAYVLEFGNATARIYANGGLVVDGMSVPITVAIPYGSGDLSQLWYAQSADELFLTHGKYPPQAFVRTGAAAFAIAPIAFLDGPYLNPDPSNTVTPSGTTGSITLTWANTNGLNAKPGVAGGLVNTDVGRLVRIKVSAAWGWCKISAVSSPTVATADVQPAVANGAAGALDGTTATTSWRLGKWSATSGYPYTLMFFQNRLVFLGFDGQPGAIDGSVIGDFFNMAPTAADGTVSAINAISWIISDDQVNAGRWLAPAGSAQAMQLGIGTSGGEYIFQPATNSQALGPNNVQAYRETSLGSGVGVSNAVTARPQRIGKSVLFASGSGRKLHEWTWTWQVNGYLGPDLAVLGEHLTRDGIVEMAYQQEPWSVVWCRDQLDNLFALTYLREQDVVAWTPHTLGGQLYGGKPLVESIACIRVADGAYDQLWLSVLRTINGTLKRTIEVMMPYFEEGNTEEAFFVDCGLSTPLNVQSGTATLTGLTNLADPGYDPQWGGDGVLVTSAANVAHVDDIFRYSGGVATVTGIVNPTHANIRTIVPFLWKVPAGANSWSLTSPAGTISGLGYLAGETVAILADGQPQTPKVAGSTVTLDTPATFVTAGLHAPARGVSLPLDPAQAGGPAQRGKMKDPLHAYVRFFETVGGKFGQRKSADGYGPERDALETIEMRTAGGLAGAAIPPQSFIRRLNVPGGTDIECRLTWLQDQPLPMTLLAIGLTVDVQEQVKG